MVGVYFCYIYQLFFTVCLKVSSLAFNDEKKEDDNFSLEVPFEERYHSGAPLPSDCPLGLLYSDTSY